jgi:hypothetical protein
MKNMNWNMREPSIHIWHKEIAFTITLSLALLFSATHYQGFALLPSRVSSLNNNSNHTMTENKVQDLSIASLENGSNGLQNGSITGDFDKKNPRNDPNCYTQGLYVCNMFGDCDSNRFDCITECDDGIKRTTGTCPNDDDRICWIDEIYICKDNSYMTQNNTGNMTQNNTGNMTQNNTGNMTQNNTGNMTQNNTNMLVTP